MELCRLHSVQTERKTIKFQWPPVRGPSRHLLTNANFIARKLKHTHAHTNNWLVTLDKILTWLEFSSRLCVWVILWDRQDIIRTKSKNLWNLYDKLIPKISFVSNLFCLHQNLSQNFTLEIRSLFFVGLCVIISKGWLKLSREWHSKCQTFHVRQVCTKCVAFDGYYLKRRLNVFSGGKTFRRHCHLFVEGNFYFDNNSI